MALVFEWHPNPNGGTPEMIIAGNIKDLRAVSKVINGAIKESLQYNEEGSAEDTIDDMYVSAIAYPNDQEFKADQVGMVETSNLSKRNPFDE